MARLAISADIGFGAQVGTPDALFELGMLYATGRDVVADLVAAHKWFNIAAAQGNVAALTRRVEIAREMSGDEIAEAQRQAREWLRTN